MLKIQKQAIVPVTQACHATNNMICALECRHFFHCILSLESLLYCIPYKEILHTWLMINWEALTSTLGVKRLGELPLSLISIHPALLTCTGNYFVTKEKQQLAVLPFGYIGLSIA